MTIRPSSTHRQPKNSQTISIFLNFSIHFYSDRWPHNLDLHYSYTHIVYMFWTNAKNSWIRRVVYEIIIDCERRFVCSKIHPNHSIRSPNLPIVPIKRSMNKCSCNSQCCQHNRWKRNNRWSLKVSNTNELYRYNKKRLKQKKSQTVPRLPIPSVPPPSPTPRPDK